MKVIYYQDPRGNFGDELNRWLWPRLLGELISGFGHHGQEERDLHDREELLFYGIGTILDSRMPSRPEKIIFGSGFGYGQKPEGIPGLNVFFVRGQRTAHILGVGPEKALTDPALLLRNFFSLVGEHEKRHEVSFMPHHSSTGGDFWRRACEALQINYIDPHSFDVETVVKEIAASRLMIAEAMHGAIVADAFRVPWIPVSSVAATNDFKWLDWCGTLDLSYAPVRFSPMYPNRGNKTWKNWLNTFRQLRRKHQLAAVRAAGSRAQLSDSQLQDGHRVALDQQVKRLRSYLLQRAGA